jgi:transcriptional regulator with XRE-family HTH domain
MCRDQLIGSVSERSLRLLRGVLDGASQADLAEAEGISASAVSQRMRKDGLAVVVAADQLLRGVA